MGQRGKWDPDNEMKLMTWPWYASGAGYVLTTDIAKLFAYPPLPFAHQKNEDRRMGVVRRKAVEPFFSWFKKGEGRFFFRVG